MDGRGGRTAAVVGALVGGVGEVVVFVVFAFRFRGGFMGGGGGCWAAVVAPRAMMGGGWWGVVLRVRTVLDIGAGGSVGTMAGCL